MSVEELFAEFFGVTNDVSAEADALKPWKARLAGGQFSVLPYRDGGSKANTYYGIAPTSREARQMVEALMSFVGPSASDLSGRPADLTNTHPEECLAQFGAFLTLRFRAVPAASNPTVWKSLERMRRVLGARPAQVAEIPQSRRTLLTQFELALASGDVGVATDIRNALQDRGLLSSENLAFLEIRLRTSLGQFEKALSLPYIDEVVRGRRPRLVTAALITALYEVEIAPFEAAGDPRGALKAFEQEVLPQFGGLFDAKGSMSESAVLKSFMLLAALPEGPRPDLRDSLLVEPKAQEQDLAWLREVAALVGEKAEKSGTPTEVAQLAILAGRYDEAFAALAGLGNPNRIAAELLIRCAIELGTLDAARHALDAVDCLPEAERKRLLSSAFWAEPLGALRELGSTSGRGAAKEAVAPDVPGSWEEWLRRLHEVGPWPGAVSVAERGVEEWPVSELEDHESATRIAEYILTTPKNETVADMRRAAIPLLLTGLERTQFNTASCGVPRALFDAIVYDDDLGDSALATATLLLSRLLGECYKEAEYASQLAGINDLWDRVQSPRTMDWALDVIGLLIDAPCPDNPSRMRLFDDVLALASKTPGRIDSATRAVLEVVARDLDAEEQLRALFPEHPPLDASSSEDIVDHTAEALEGKLIGIYSLNTSAAVRTRSVIESRFPGVEVETNGDYVSTSKLRQLASKADILLVTTHAAKHAATDAIRRSRPREKATLIAPSRGSAGMLRLLFEHLELVPSD